MKIESVIGAFADHMLYLGPFGAATNVKLVSNLLVALHIAGTAQAMAIGLHAGVKIDLLIEAIATGSGGSTQFGIRAPWMAERRFKPLQGPIPGLQHYIEMIGEFADGGAMIDVIGSLPREKSKKSVPQKGTIADDKGESA